MRVGRVVEYLLLPGVVLHELAHASVATALPGITVTEVDLTSHVRHQGRYTLLSSVLVAYAPLLVNTGVAVWALLTMDRIAPVETPRQLGFVIGLGYVAFVAGVTAIPSVTDVLAPLRTWWQQLPSLRGLVALPVVPFLFLVSVPWLLIAYPRERSLIAYVGISGIYTAVLVLVAFDIVAVPAPESLVERVVETIRQTRPSENVTTIWFS